MKRVTNKIKCFSSALVALGASLAVSSVACAWGPERKTFTLDEPATYPTFNSITDNPTIGDERNFVRVGEIDAKVTDLDDTVEVVPGRQYLVYIYFHNNASSTFNDEEHHFSGVATVSRMSSSFSKVLTPEESGTITATIAAKNTNPESVWDEAYMTTKSEKVLMRYIAGSSRIYSDWKANDSIMPSSLFTEEGTLLGLNALNGVIPGCEEYHGVVTYVLQAEELGGSIDKTVSKDGEDFRESVNLAPGEEATYKLTIANTGDIALTNATVKDALPSGLSLVPGSVRLYANDSNVTEELSDNIFDTGYNLGTIGTGNTVYITYRVVADGGDFDCTGQELTNNASLTYDSEDSTGDTKTDSTTITVKKEDCEEPVGPLDNCETNPGLPECESEKEKKEKEEKTCATNPEMEGCSRLPETGPLEVVLAIVIILGIGGGGYYLYRTKKVLKQTTAGVKGEKTEKNLGVEDSDNNNPNGSA